ncbi:MAG: GNAT family N-acetyltransferase [Candidatus Thorarchaeota archaeon]|nr:GNAT family N-acetyltransferase [Candidatus Thorarchaeota archaeon]
MSDSEHWKKLKRGYKDAREIISNPCSEAYVAWSRDDVAGFIIIEMVGSLKGYIKSIFVPPERRGEGIGSELIKYAEERIFSETPNVFLLVSSFNKGARKLYQKLGYEEIGEFKDYVVRGYSEILFRKTKGPLNEFN